MAIKKITIFWRDIPSQILIQRGRKRKKRMLEHRFQEAIDRAAMRAGKGGSGAYIAEWRRVSEMIESDINDDDYLEEEIKNIQSSYTDDDLKHLIRNHGENRSH